LEKFTPRTGNVIWRMRSGSKCILNGGLWAMADVITRKSRTDKCRFFKLGGWVEHVTHHDQCPRSKGQGHRVT